MKRILKYLAIFVGIGLLVGCTSREDDYRDLRKRLAILNDVYQTEKVEDLFNLFPNGFEVYHSRRLRERKITVDLVGDGASHQITGTVTLEEGLSKPVKVIDKQPVQYVDGQLQALDGEELPEEIRNERFLFQVFDLNEDFYKTASFQGMKSGYGPASSNYNLVYHIVDSKLGNFLSVPDDTELIIDIGGGYELDKLWKVNKRISISSSTQVLYFSERIIER